MTEKDVTHGLSCPRCGGMVLIPEGQALVKCPYCEMVSLVRGERGVRQYQIPLQANRERAMQALRGFLGGHSAIAADAARNATLQETFLAHLPFWASWARVLGWVFGQERVRRGEHTHYKPREIKFDQDVSWNGAACDVGEFGVGSIPLTGRPLQPADHDALHSSGMVFEPVGSASDAVDAAVREFNTRVGKAGGLDRVNQVFVRFINQRFGIVYYPLWVLRYAYRGRAFQVVVDGYSGEVLYGKAPGNTLYRAAMLVGGMALGAMLGIDGSAAAFAAASNMRGDSAGAFIVGGLVALVAGFGLMGAAYRTFRFGEQFEYRRDAPASPFGSFNIKDITTSVEDLDTWINRLS
jgi:hypothetical protein